MLTAAAKRCAITARARRHRDQRRRRTPTPSTRTKSSSSSPVVGRPVARSIGRALCRLVGVVVSRCRCGARVLCRHRCRLFHWLLFVDQQYCGHTCFPSFDLRPVTLIYTTWTLGGCGDFPHPLSFLRQPFCFSTSTRRFKFGPNIEIWGSGGGTFSAACVVIIVLLGQGMHSRSRAPWQLYCGSLCGWWAVWV